MENSEVTLAMPGTTLLSQAPMPRPRAHEVLIRVEYVGICGSDVHSFTNGPFLPPPDPAQKIGLGHECAGTVVEAGAEAAGLKAGDRVCIEPGVPCGTCRYCREGRYNLCPQMDFMATQPNYRGALTQYLCHPAAFTYRLPQGMTTLEGALVEPAAVGMHAALLAGVKPGARVAVLGAGCIGLMTLQACRLLGASEILVSDVLPKRLEMARRLGAGLAVNAREQDAEEACAAYFDGMGADLVFETAGSSATARQALGMVARGGRIMVVGTIPGETPVNFLSINREVSIQTVFRYANCFPATIAAIASGALDVTSMVTHRYCYGESQLAFEESVSRRQDIVKAVIEVSGTETEGLYHVG